MIDIKEIKAGVRANQYAHTHHAEIERRADELTFAQIEETLLSGEVPEQYHDTGRGESCLVVGLAERLPIHIACGWCREKVVLIHRLCATSASSLIPGPGEENESAMQLLRQRPP